MRARPPPRPEDVALALGEPSLRRILARCVAQARSVLEISHDARIPLTTTYRLVHRLEALHLLAVERSAMTVDKRRYDLYRSRIKAARLDVGEEGDDVWWEANESSVRT